MNIVNNIQENINIVNNIQENITIVKQYSLEHEYC